MAPASTVTETALHARGGAAADAASDSHPPDEAAAAGEPGPAVAEGASGECAPRRRPSPSFPRKRQPTTNSESGEAPCNPVSDRPLATAPSFIETQFPVSRLSKESYKERKANYSQTLTGLGKWWGRKPLVMVRAVILGLLMPASDNPHKDRDVFLALLTMDDDGLWRRKRRTISLKEVHRRLSPQERAQWFASDTDASRPRLKKGTKAEAKQRLQRIVFSRMSYDEKLVWCDRPEHVDGPSPEAWRAINEHLGTSATSLPELVRELGKWRFGHTPRIGDAFCGGGSVPFEAARLGCDAFGSDLNPVAALLTWGALNIVGGDEEVAERVRQAQAEVFNSVDRQVTEWRIEHNDAGWRADAFLYCTEATCPDCGWAVPLAPSWVVGEKTRAVAQLKANPAEKRFEIEIRSGVSKEALAAASNAGTVKKSRLECPNPDCDASTPMAAIRGDRRSEGGRGYGLRLWENADLVPRSDDVFQERLYCVRWRLPSLAALLWAEQGTRGLDSSEDDGDARSRSPASRYPDVPSAPVPDWTNLDRAISALIEMLSFDKQREVVVLRQRDWLAEDRACQKARSDFEAERRAGLPKAELAAERRRAEELEGAIRERDERIRALTKSLPEKLYRSIDSADLDREALTLSLLRERFSKWQALGHIPSRKIAPGAKTNEPISTRGWTHWHHLFTTRQLLSLGLSACMSKTKDLSKPELVACTLGLWKCCDRNSKLCVWDSHPANEKVANTFMNQAFNPLMNFGSRSIKALTSSWTLPITNHESIANATVEPADARQVTTNCDFWLTDPPYADAINYHELSEVLISWSDYTLEESFGWYTDSKRALAIKGSNIDFRRGMVDCYRNLTAHMPDNGLQVVMFTHQDASVWADLTLILWASGLRVTTAWTIATETESALKEGNYVQGTVLLVLRKQASEETVFLDELVPEVESEVERQLDSMTRLDDREAPNFSDADYQLAAYAAALRVLTQYRSIDDVDVAYQLTREQAAGDTNPIQDIIEGAVRTASNYLVPHGLPDHLWRQLGPEEKLYLKGLEVESHGELRTGVYQEFARGFGVHDYRFMLRSGKANETRLKTASEFQRRELGDSSFGRSLVRHALYAVWRAVETDDASDSRTWLRTEFEDYWQQREALTSVLRYLAAVDIGHWHKDATAARTVAGTVENDHV